MKKLIPIFVLLFGSVGVLIWVGVVHASIPIVRVTDVERRPLQEGESAYIQVDDGKVFAIESLVPLRFSVAPDKDPAASIRVEFPGSVPENFKLGIPVSLRGEYDHGRKVFKAYRIITQCPTKYVASEEAKEAARAESGAGARWTPPEAPALERAGTPKAVN